MPKVKLKKLENYPFKTEIKVRVSDLNYGAHLGYDRVLTLAHQARVELFEKWGVTETDLGDGKTGIVAADVNVNYLGEAFLNDLLQVETIPIEIGAISFRLAHRFFNKVTSKDVALLEIGFVGFDYQRRAPGRLPAKFMEHLKAAEQGG